MGFQHRFSVTINCVRSDKVNIKKKVSQAEEQDASIEIPFDCAIMQHCLELACRTLGRTALNPLVSPVIIREEQTVGQGFHLGVGHLPVDRGTERLQGAAPPHDLWMSTHLQS